MGMIQRANQDVKVHLTDFDGPIDLLLQLVREHKLDIKTVRLGEMTAQYMAYLTELPTLDLDLASEFIEVGAILVEIKSKQILPRPADEKIEPVDEEEQLRQRLAEYALFKEASETLKTMDDVGRYYRAPAVLKVNTNWKLDGVTFDDLTAAFTAILARVGEKSAKVEKTTIKLDRFTVADKIKDVVGRLKTSNRLRFSQLFDADITRSEVINTFLAVLELLKRQLVACQQDQAFGEIEIVKGGAFGDGNFDLTDSEFGA
ncbi:MAG: segregation/condensation protein A [Prevotella sp.]|nr:segregation/condensation protein A [Prevotella sp.]